MGNIAPYWNGFNLVGMVMKTGKNGNPYPGKFEEDHFRWIQDWGFNFTRIPMTYLWWVNNRDPWDINEEELSRVDQAVELGEKYGIHVNLNFHRGPGWCVNAEQTEPFSLWKHTEGLNAFCAHWELFTKRYKGISSDKLSFNLINEPGQISEDSMTRDDHERVMRETVRRIREIDQERRIIIDGLNYGNLCCPELADLDVIQSTRAYQPMRLTHYKAHWIDSEGWGEPRWPGIDNGNKIWDRNELDGHFRPWTDLMDKGVGVHCGEGGAFQFTPHKVMLAWLRDVLEILSEHRIGFALWNLTGAFGVVNSGREDCEYEEFHGNKLDRDLLDLLLEFN